MSAVECFVKDEVTTTLQHCTMTLISHMYLSNGDQQSQERHMCLYVLFMWQSLGRNHMCMYLSSGDQESQEGHVFCMYYLCGNIWVENIFICIYLVVITILRKCAFVCMYYLCGNL